MMDFSSGLMSDGNKKFYKLGKTQTRKTVTIFMSVRTI